MNDSLFVEALLEPGVTEETLGDVRYDECRQLLVTRDGTPLVEADLTAPLGTETREVKRDQDAVAGPIDRGSAGQATRPREDDVTMVRRDEPR